MNHWWPNVGHDSLVHAVLEGAEAHRETLRAADRKIRVISYDVRRRHQIPASPNGRFRLYVGTGGPGHLDPRLNDGTAAWTQGIKEDAAWEKPLFDLFDSIHEHDSAALVAICHSFGLICRWSGIARPVQRTAKSTGMPTNTLTETAEKHPWFSKFAAQLPDRRQYRVLDNRLFDLVPETATTHALAFESPDSSVLTMIELARDEEGMPRVFAANHHPEIIDREHILWVLEEKRLHGEVTDAWYEERRHTMSELFHGESERQSRLTSEYTLLGLLRHHIGKLAAG